MNRLTKVFAASFLLTGSIALTGCSTLSPNSDADENARPPVAAIPGVKSIQPQKQEADSNTPANDPSFDPDALQNLPEGTDIVIRPGKERTIHEYRVNGVLYSIKVIPKVGKPYYLVAVDRNGNFRRANRPQMLIPSWRIFEW
ncbi:DUF2782 domain-containing protein [Sansalvadorimonas verongulae]|uniref:DUF2782 domain-containing protein n=1 Tax=Sansalvadorimonas verongulae TaxID=2172824 RepID=UPI0012BD7581|nr:DUF2782 domain-containing protein [Sansalvadorimonas verongulae]MTI14945.1 DUF2782 domain-containing protein [Sansalvadorimonas verongulae]